jgi:hypothetical protein
MTHQEIIALQTAIGTPADGFWGPKSVVACRKHLTALMPSPNPWPATTEKALTAFYGLPGDESNLVSLPVQGLGVCYEGTPVRSVLCHIKVAGSLLRILTKLSESHPEILRCYAGCYNNRSIRGGIIPSLHARGAAIDLWPEENSNIAAWPEKARMPLAVMEAFAREGWLPAGAFWSRDSMHAQATR